MDMFSMCATYNQCDSVRLPFYIPLCVDPLAQYMSSHVPASIMEILLLLSENCVFFHLFLGKKMVCSMLCELQYEQTRSI